MTHASIRAVLAAAGGVVLLVSPVLVSITLTVLRIVVPPALPFSGPGGIAHLAFRADAGPFVALGGLLLAVVALFAPGGSRRIVMRHR